MREIVGILRRTYCQTLGVEFMHISNAAQKSWIQERIEGRDKEITFTRADPMRRCRASVRSRCSRGVCGPGDCCPTRLPASEALSIFQQG